MAIGVGAHPVIAIRVGKELDTLPQPGFERHFGAVQFLLLFRRAELRKRSVRKAMRLDRNSVTLQFDQIVAITQSLFQRREPLEEGREIDHLPSILLEITQLLDEGPFGYVEPRFPTVGWWLTDLVEAQDCQRMRSGVHLRPLTSMPAPERCRRPSARRNTPRPGRVPAYFVVRNHLLPSPSSALPPPYRENETGQQHPVGNGLDPCAQRRPAYHWPNSTVSDR